MFLQWIYALTLTNDPAQNFNPPLAQPLHSYAVYFGIVTFNLNHVRNSLVSKISIWNNWHDLENTGWWVIGIDRVLKDSLTLETLLLSYILKGYIDSYKTLYDVSIYKVYGISLAMQNMYKWTV